MNWDAAFINKRSEYLCGRVFDVIDKWLQVYVTLLSEIDAWQGFLFKYLIQISTPSIDQILVKIGLIIIHINHL